MGDSVRGPSRDYSKGDRAESVAAFVLQAIVEGGAEYFVSDFIRKMAGR